MSGPNPLASKPENILTSLLERFHSEGRRDDANDDPKPVFITSDGRTTTTEIAARLECDLKYGLPLKASARHVYVAGDFALIGLDRSIDGNGLSRKYVEGSASGVVRRADRRWQYLIDNNQRTDVAALSDGATLLGTNITAT